MPVAIDIRASTGAATRRRQAFLPLLLARLYRRYERGSPAGSANPTETGESHRILTVRFRV
jgi:hypothetical protein